MNAARLHITHEDRLRGIVRAYRAAVDDPKAVLPTPLALLIEAAAIALSDQDARYADHMNQLAERPSENSERVMELARGRS